MVALTVALLIRISAAETQSIIGGGFGFVAAGSIVTTPPLLMAHVMELLIRVTMAIMMPVSLQMMDRKAVILVGVTNRDMSGVFCVGKYALKKEGAQETQRRSLHGTEENVNGDEMERPNHVPYDMGNIGYRITKDIVPECGYDFRRRKACCCWPSRNARNRGNASRRHTV
ncbi:hypothetical protein E4U42_001356 [Claviceps africana]|uniref:Uncharacterized protein n=1 Tax=Claviceps africana TaxID=83212 RepID=A0A8K0NM46_9HYPO|nr:hypothetical protein E4U42_001356 [Claviceps africana]